MTRQPTFTQLATEGTPAEFRMKSMYQPGGAWLLSDGEVAVSPLEPSGSSRITKSCSCRISETNCGGGCRWEDNTRTPRPYFRVYELNLGTTEGGIYPAQGFSLAVEKQS